MPNTARATAKRDLAQANRRRHPRVPVGLPGAGHLSGCAAARTGALSDSAAGGVRVRAPASAVPVGHRAPDRVVVEGSGTCAAEGPVTRLSPGGEFIVELDKTSPAFRAFVSSLAA